MSALDKDRLIWSRPVSYYTVLCLLSHLMGTYGCSDISYNGSSLLSWKAPRQDSSLTVTLHQIAQHNYVRLAQKNTRQPCQWNNTGAERLKMTRWDLHPNKMQVPPLVIVSPFTANLIRPSFSFLNSHWLLVCSLVGAKANQLSMPAL